MDSLNMKSSKKSTPRGDFVECVYDDPNGGEYRQTFYKNPEGILWGRRPDSPIWEMVCLFNHETYRKDINLLYLRKHEATHNRYGEFHAAFPKSVEIVRRDYYLLMWLHGEGFLSNPHEVYKNKSLSEATAAAIDYSFYNCAVVALVENLNDEERDVIASNAVCIYMAGVLIYNEFEIG